jgi:chromosome segregation ATPase
MAILRNELGAKQLEVVELEQKVKNAEAQKEEFRARYEQVKKDMIGLKKSIDMEKSQTLEKQAKELESLKNELRLKEARDNERREFEAMRN